MMQKRHLLSLSRCRVILRCVCWSGATVETCWPVRLMTGSLGREAITVRMTLLPSTASVAPLVGVGPVTASKTGGAGFRYALLPSRPVTWRDS